MGSCPAPLVCSAGTAPGSTSDIDWLTRLSNLGLSWYNVVAGPPSPAQGAAASTLPTASAQAKSFFSSTGGQWLIVGAVAVGVILLLRSR